eukprot:759009-Hanusia_phi.AAC.2
MRRSVRGCEDEITTANVTEWKRYNVQCGEPVLGDGKVGYWTMEEAKFNPSPLRRYPVLNGTAQLGASSCGPCSILNAVAMIGRHACRCLRGWRL